MYPLQLSLTVPNAAAMTALLAVVNGGPAPTVPLAQPVQVPAIAPTPTQPSSDAGPTGPKPDIAAPAASTPSSTPTAASQPDQTPQADGEVLTYDKHIKARLQAYAAKNMQGAVALLGNYGAKKGGELKTVDYPAVLADLTAAGF